MATTKKIRMVKCGYSKCLHENKEIEIDQAVKDGTRYYHPDCLKTKENIKEIVDFFVNNFNPNPVYSQLQAVVSNIIFKKNISSDYLLFALKYYAKNNLNLNYPQGIYYIIQNKSVQREYDKQLSKKQKSIQISIEEEEDQLFTYKAPKQKGFDSILG